MKTKILVSIALFFGMGYASTLPLTNTAGVNQLNDTNTSSSNAQIINYLVADWWIVFIILLVLIWAKDLSKWYKSL